MKTKGENEFFKLLLKNDKNELENFLLLKGKSPKPICPIIFETTNEEMKTNDCKVKKLV